MFHGMRIRAEEDDEVRLPTYIAYYADLIYQREPARELVFSDSEGEDAEVRFP